MERTLVILKPCTIQRGLIGKIINRFEQKGLILVGMKMMQLTDFILNAHYSHLKDQPFFKRIKESMQTSPVVVCCWKGIDAINVVRSMTGLTNGRNALPGTIRGDFSMSVQENIVHASDSQEAAERELERFFDKKELFEYEFPLMSNLYANDEC